MRPVCRRWVSAQRRRLVLWTLPRAFLSRRRCITRLMIIGAMAKRIFFMGYLTGRDGSMPPGARSRRTGKGNVSPGPKLQEFCGLTGLSSSSSSTGNSVLSSSVFVCALVVASES